MTTTRMLVFALFVLSASSGFAIQQPCNAETADAWQWVFNFPEASQKGGQITVSHESLTNPVNVNVKLDAEDKDWYLKEIDKIASDPRIGGKQFSSLVLYRNLCNKEIVVKLPGEEFALSTPPDARTRVSAQTQTAAGSYLEPRLSKTQKVLSVFLRFTEIGVYAATGGNHYAAFGAGFINDLVFRPLLLRPKMVAASYSSSSGSYSRNSNSRGRVLKGRWWDKY